jgi:hypothetical protein
MSRQSLGKVFPWVAGLVLVAGVVAFGTVYVFDTGESVESKITDRETGPAVVNAPRENVALDPEARRVAGEFILTAVARDDLAKSYTITHPDLRQGLSLAQWKTGNIPVQFYPAEAIDTATFKIDESYPDEAVLQVALVPKEGTTVKPQIFYIGLKKVGGKWLVYYWAPRSGVAIPSVG